MENISKPEDQLITLLRCLKKISPKQVLLEELDLSFSQILMLEAVANSPGNTMTQIANQLEVTLPSVSQTAFLLLKNGDLELRRDSADRRIKRLYLTPAGEKIIRKLNQDVRRIAVQLLSRLLPEEQIIFLDLLEKIVSNSEGSDLNTKS